LLKAIKERTHVFHAIKIVKLRLLQGQSGNLVKTEANSAVIAKDGQVIKN
jgi:hypothetical protein